MLTTRRILLATGFLALLIAGNWYTALFAPVPAAPPEASGGVVWQTEPINEKWEYEHWSKRVREVGGEKAYAEFAAHVASRDFPSQHTMAHFFGRALYEQEDLKGVSVCDDRFAYGCFHEFLAYAVDGHGVSVVAPLDAVCQKQPDFLRSAACQHGIGHGIVASVGYGEKDLIRALEVCKTLPNAGSMGGCYAGVFMEYNRHSMIAADSGPRLPVDGDFISPCDDIDTDYRAVCVLWQPLWWQGELFEGGHSPEVMRKLGDMCRALGEEMGYKETCFYGLGFVAAPETATEQPDALTMCPAAAETPQEERWCLNYGAYIAGALVDVEHGLSICKGMAPEDKALCERYARTKGSVLSAEDLEP